MRGHFGHEIFNFPPEPPTRFPWDSNFGPRRHGFGPGGRGRPSFGPGWPGFARHGCRSHGPPGFDHSPDREHPHRHGSPPPPRYGGGHHGPQHRHGSPPHHHGSRCGHQGPPKDCHGPSDNHGPCGRHDPPNHHGSAECGHQGPPKDHHGHHGPRSWGPCHPFDHDYGSWPFNHGPGRGHHHHWPGFGRPCPRAFDWPRFGSNWRRPHFGHRRPCGRPDKSPTRDCEDCENRPCCSGNKENCGCNEERGRKRRPCCVRNKDQNEIGDTVLVQRIVVEKAPARPQSV